MHLCIDIGNTQIFCGLYRADKLVVTFRYNSNQGTSSDQFGTFVNSILQANSISPSDIKKVAIASVVPDLNYSIRSAIVKYLNKIPIFLSSIDNKFIEIQCENVKEFGADRLANAIAAVYKFANSDIIILDFGTATTVCVISSNSKFINGAILPGLKTSARALGSATAKLPVVDIVKPNLNDIASTSSNIQIGIYYGQLGAVREIITNFKQHYNIHDCKVIATGGFAYLYKDENLFDCLIPDLVLQGVNIYLSNQS